MDHTKLMRLRFADAAWAAPPIPRRRRREDSAVAPAAAVAPLSVRSTSQLALCIRELCATEIKLLSSARFLVENVSLDSAFDLFAGPRGVATAYVRIGAGGRPRRGGLDPELTLRRAPLLRSWSLRECCHRMKIFPTDKVRGRFRTTHPYLVSLTHWTWLPLPQQQLGFLLWCFGARSGSRLRRPDFVQCCLQFASRAMVAATPRFKDAFAAEPVLAHVFTEVRGRRGRRSRRAPVHHRRWRRRSSRRTGGCRSIGRPWSRLEGSTWLARSGRSQPRRHTWSRCRT